MGDQEKNGSDPEYKPTPQEIARRARLRYVCDSEPGIRRQRCGRGFTYLSPSGQRVSQKRHLERIESLVIPPAWTDVWICRFATGHLQATGRDDRNRKQYRYHDRWQEMTGRAKFSALSYFGQTLPKLRRKVADDLNREGLPWEKVTALAVLLLDEAGLRVGNREYAADNDSYGLTTLQDRHAKIDGSRLVLSFHGKAGQKHRIAIDNARLAHWVAECRNLRGKSLFQYETPQGRQPLTSHDVNEYLSLISEGITAKMFRTWHGSRVVAESLFHFDTARSISARKKLLSQAIRNAAVHLGNTPAICRNYYVHPRITEAFLQDEFPEIFSGFALRRKARFTEADQILLRILEGSGKTR